MKKLQSKPLSQTKSGLHPRSKHGNRYDFTLLTESLPELKKFVSINPFGDESIDFANPEAVKKLNQALLKYFYQINFWDIPSNYLCPPIPGRADYIHQSADLLGITNGGQIPKGNSIQVLDIGVGANCIYPLIAQSEYGWKMVGSDIDPVSIGNAQKIIELNSLEEKIHLRHQENPTYIFKDIIKPDDFFDLTLCNPPFHSSAEEAREGSSRKINNLSKKQHPSSPSKKPVLNFGGVKNELWCEGGEASFITRMIKESATYRTQCLWFTTLVSKATTLPQLYVELKKMNVVDFKTIDMAQGQKKSRILAWTFCNPGKQNEWKTRNGK